MLGSIPITTIRRVPISLHVTAILLLPWVATSLLRHPEIAALGGGFAVLVSAGFVLILLGSIALHELGHTVVAQRYGIAVRDIVLTPIGGVARLARSPSDPRHEIRIALAGPMVSVVLALAGWLLSLLPGVFMWIGSITALCNTMLVLFNLIPAFPMDGGRVLRGWLAQRNGLVAATERATDLGRIFSLLFFAYGLFNHFPLLLIGIFIYLAGSAELRMVRLRAWQDGQNPFTSPATQPDFVVSPPPYALPKSNPVGDGFLFDVLQSARDLWEESTGRSLR